MTDKNGIEPVPIAAITPATPKDVSVTLTGVAAKAEAGSFTPSLSVPLGVAARGEAGSFTPSLPAEDRYVGSTIPFPPNTGSPPAEAEGEYVAHAVEFGPGLEGGIADAGVVGGFAISPDEVTTPTIGGTISITKSWPMAACLSKRKQRKPSLRFSLRLAVFVKKTAPVRARVLQFPRG